MVGLTTALTALLLAFASSALAAPVAAAAAVPRQASSTYWVANIQRNGAVAYGDAGYTVYRNVLDYGAKGDGVTDDTAAINAAISAGNRCGQGCSSSTTTPAMVFFPSGTYLVSQPIVQLYYTQMIGDALSPPTLKAAPGFTGMAVIDSDPYVNGVNYWVNQNNFYRQVRNFVIDLTGMPCSAGAGIHWQVAQATSLQNIVFNMCQDSSEANKQLGIFMDNGSGGFMSDLTFNGGQYGAFFGNQQFTTRNMTFNNCQTAVFMNWNWVWSLQGLNINNCGIGVDMSSGGTSQTVGSVLLTDSVISNTPIGIKTSYSVDSRFANGSLVLDNVDMSTNVPVAISFASDNSTVLAGNTKIASFVQGRAYASNSSGEAVQASQPAVSKPTSLLDSTTGYVFTRSRPQYENEPASAFVSVKANGAKGDGVTDDTAAIQNIFNSATTDQIVYFDHGAYVITSTVKVPKDIRITGEMWPLIMAGGNSSFQDQTKPQPVFQIGQPGDVGSVEISDMVFQTLGPQPGAVMIEWNVAQASQGSAGLWDTHFRIGGSAGTQLQLQQCAKNPNVTNTPNPACMGAFLLLHITPQASAYLENSWAWVADHDLEPAANSQQIDIYNGRGILIESQNGPVWGWGTAAEHSVLYNYQLANTANIYLSAIQTETAYFQGNPEATTPFDYSTQYGDPDFTATCSNGTGSCARTWGFRTVNSSDVLVYGAGLYSFFDNYDQTCLDTESCQDNMVTVEGSQVTFFGLSTKAATNMVLLDGQIAALQEDNPSTYCQTVALFGAKSAQAPQSDGSQSQGSGSQSPGSQSSGSQGSSSQDPQPQASQPSASASSASPASVSEPSASPSSASPSSASPSPASDSSSSDSSAAEAQASPPQPTETQTFYKSTMPEGKQEQ